MNEETSVEEAKLEWEENGPRPSEDIENVMLDSFDESDRKRMSDQHDEWYTTDKSAEQVKREFKGL